MKLVAIAFALIPVASVSAFWSHRQPTFKSKSLDAFKDVWAPAASAFVACTLLSQVASAGLPISNDFEQGRMNTGFSSTSSLIASDSPDVSLPSYGGMQNNQGGFGVGVESFSGPDFKQSEAELQKVAMQKAEVARKIRLEEKRAELKRRDAEQKEEKKAKEAEGKLRVKELFG